MFSGVCDLSESKASQIYPRKLVKIANLASPRQRDVRSCYQRTWELFPSPPSSKTANWTPRAFQFVFPGENLPFQSSSCSFLSVFSTQLLFPSFTEQLVKRVCCCCVLSALGPDDAYLDDSHCHSISTTCLSSMQPREYTPTNLMLRSWDVSQSLLSLAWSDSGDDQSEWADSFSPGAFLPIGRVQRADGVRRETELSSGSEMVQKVAEECTVGMSNKTNRHLTHFCFFLPQFFIHKCRFKNRYFYLWLRRSCNLLSKIKMQNKANIVPWQYDCPVYLRISN